MADDIIQFSPGAKVTAEETNQNNLLLKEWALDNATTEKYIDGKIDTLTNSVNTQISNLSSSTVKTTGSQSISGNKTFTGTATFSGTIKVPNSATVGTAISTAAISKSSNGYLKMGNGIIIQWGTFSGASKKSITFPTAFATAGRVTFASTQGSDNSRIACTAINSISKTGFTCTTIATNGGGSGVVTGTVYWIAIGY